MEREFERFPLTTEFRYRRLDDETGYLRTGTVKADVGEGGLFLPTTTVFPEGTSVEVIFRIPTRTIPLQAVGCVAWSGTRDKGTGMGIEFRGLDVAARLEIHRFSARGDWGRETAIR